MILGARSIVAAIAALSALTLTATLGARSAHALEVDDVIAKVDEANNPFKTRRFTMKMEIREPDGSSRINVTRVAEGGHGKQRFVLYQSPADVKGMGVLVQDRNTLYIYMPEYRRVRRVAMHARKQTFMGSDVTLDDSAQLTYGGDYAGKIVSEEGGKVRVELTPKAGRDLAYTKINLVVDTATWLIDELQYFDDGGLVKTESRSNVTKVRGKPMQTHIEITDAKTRHQTIIDIVETEVNVRHPRGLFTKRGLLRGRL